MSEETTLAMPVRRSGRFLRQAVTLAAIMFASLSGYLVVLKWRGPDPVAVTWIPADDWFPFLPAWVWVYLIPYLIGPVVVGAMTPQTFRWFVRRGLTTVAITLVVFILWPTQTAPRPPHTLQAGWTAGLYEWMIAVDEPPANAAPSLHISLTTLLALALLRDFRRWWPAILCGTGLVWLATLLTRQHHLIDVATGAVLAFAVAYLFPDRKVDGAEGCAASP